MQVYAKPQRPQEPRGFIVILNGRLERWHARMKDPDMIACLQKRLAPEFNTQQATLDPSLPTRHHTSIAQDGGFQKKTFLCGSLRLLRVLCGFGFCIFALIS